MSRIPFILSCLLLLAFQHVLSLDRWPQSIETKGGAKIIIYQPQNENLKGDILNGRAAVSVRLKSTDEPIFGAFWFAARMSTNRDTRLALLESLKIKEVKLPGVEDTLKIARFKEILETEIPKWKLEISMDELLVTLEEGGSQYQDELKNDLSTILYVATPSTLVLIDGEPKLKEDPDLKIQRVINTAFLILQSAEDKKFYLSAGTFWYVSSSLTEGWQNTSKLPKSIKEVDKKLKAQAKESPAKENDEKPRAIIVSTVPAELIQSTTEADFAPIQGTTLLYMINSTDDIFMNIDQQKYYVLLSGRWYVSSSLKGPWSFIAADKIPAEFQKIPEGSAKDGVLSSVPGTDAAKEAVMDAQIPQTAKVNRKTATCTVKYDGEPKFEKIEGTSLQLAMNTTSSVLLADKKYYCVENGIWFESSAAVGPWVVSESRPAEVDKIPASSSAYNTKYVYIYDSTPEYVYVGYTPGYMGCYTYGGVVVYGTGYYYNPWYGPYYYPRPATYGFSMHYNPWTGWSMGVHYSSGFFHMSIYGGGGYWGPPMYRPPYYAHHHHGGYYGRNNVNIGNDVNINVDRSNNIYNNRNDVSTKDVQRGDNKVSNRDQPGNAQGKDRPGQQPAQDKSRPQNNMMTDKSGNVYQRGDNGTWQERNNREGQGSGRNQNSMSQMDQQQLQRDRGQTRNNNFQQSNMGGNMGGFSRGGGGGGGRRR